MTKDILLEIGTEEIPAKFMPSILVQLKKLAEQILTEQKIAFTSVRTMGTPRRLALLVSQADEKQADVSSKNKGPAVKIAFDHEGKPTKAAMGFARGQGVDVTALTVENGYVYAQVARQGVETISLLPALLQQLVTSLTFSKSMHWADLDFRFVRPIRWIVALWGSEVVPFELAQVQAGNKSMGHRFLSTGQFTVTDMESYEESLSEHFVIVDQDKRRALIVKQLNELVAEHDGELLMDKDLLEEVVYLVEYPTALCGEFDISFMALPEAAIITPMKDHQRYFPITDKNGKLMPLFLTVRNGGDYKLDTVQHGNERVLRARLDDAKFFFNEDKKTKLADRVDQLKTIVFQDGLGTLLDKAGRLDKITTYLRDKLSLMAVDSTELKRAVMLAKTDLLTGMVTEFTELQGLMGKEYALLDGESSAVAEAIYEQYLPRFAGDVLPQTDMGKLLGLADKFDTIVATFSRGLIPTGSQDPFALRRQTIGILNILNVSEWDLDAKGVFSFVLDLFDLSDSEKETTLVKLTEFFQQRLRNIYLDNGRDYRIIDAALDVGDLNIYGITCRVDGLVVADILNKIELLQAFTRVGNLAKGVTDTEVLPTLFETDYEKKLYELYQTLVITLKSDNDARDYKRMVAELEKGIGVINAFLDNVMVMVDNEAVKQNRLHLLNALFSLTKPFGNINKLS